MSDISIENCQTVLQNASLDPGNLLEFSVEPFNDGTNGFLGEHYKLIIHTKESEENVNVHTFFVKTLPKSQKFKEYVEILGIFYKESLFYTQIVPKLPKKYNNFAPTCYLCTQTFVVLEDVTAKGFEIYNNYFGFDQWDGVLRSLAQMHTAAIVYEETTSTVETKYRFINEFERALQETTFVFDINHPRGKWVRNCTNTIIECLNRYTNCNRTIEVTHKLLKYIFNMLPEMVQPSKKFRNVISHGDLWKNNVLFRKEPDSHQEAIIIDYQLIRYVPPAFDLLTALYLNCEKGYLEMNFDSLLNVYYTYFSHFLRIQGINPHNIMPLSEFLKSVQYYKMPAIIEATFFGTIIFISEDLAKEIVSNETVFQEFTYDDRAKYIINELKNNQDFADKFEVLLKHLVNITMELNIEDV